MKLVSLTLITFFFILLLGNCTRDQIMEIESDCGEVVTYENQIKPIIDNACAYSGCHAGGAPGNYVSYQEIKKYIGNDRIERRVLINRDMPPIYSTLGPTELSDQELELFKCWIQSGYPEN